MTGAIAGMDSMASWFGIKDGRTDFYILNDVDSSLLFARQQLDDQLQRMLRKSFRTGNPPKFVLYGDWGVGKTHTMRHIKHVIETTPGYGAQVVFVELPDITAASTFQVAHAALLDALGQTTVKQWMIQYQTKYQGDSPARIQAATQSEDIARAFLSLIGFGESSRLSWDWLRGERLSGGDSRSAGLPTMLGQSTQLANVLRMLGRLCRDVEGKLLILMLDEATKLTSVTNSDAIQHWTNSFKILAEQQTKEVGLVISASFRDRDDMPDPLSDEQIQTRFGLDHYLQLFNFGPDEAEAFTRALLTELIDGSKRERIVEDFRDQADGESINPGGFPFTEAALPRFVDYTCRNGGITVPRDIQHALDSILNGAIDDGRHILSRSYLETVLAGG